jgi:hypothetical protein
MKLGLFQTASGKLVNADVNGSYNILRLGIGVDVTQKRPFNPHRTKNINELGDVCHFRWLRPADRRPVSGRNGS